MTEDWKNVEPAIYQQGDLVKKDSADCGSYKWRATYTGGSVTTAECNASSAIARNEITKTNLKSIVIGDCVKYIARGCFNSATTLSAVTFPQGLIGIGSDAFSFCNSLTSVTIPSNVKMGYGSSEGEGMFSGCQNLKRIDSYGTGCTIDYFATFCPSLTAVTLGNITCMGRFAFAGCTSLASITINTETPPYLDEGAFSNTSNNLVIYVPASAVETYKSSTYGHNGGWVNYADRIQAIP